MAKTGTSCSLPAVGRHILYQRLDSNDFRLLKLEGDSFIGSTPKEMAFTLQVYAVHEAPDYVAVSYTWSQPYRDLDDLHKPTEPPELDRQVSINGIHVPVTKNMWDALVAALAYGDGLKYIWVDACCINQSNFAERSSQVLLMDKIYSTATVVICFLGPLHHDLDSFYWLTHDFMISVARLSLAKEGQSITEQSLWSVRDQLTEDKRHFEASLIGAHRFYYSCQWFRRIWVKQEVVLARKLRLICGRVEIPWDGLLLAEELFLSTRWTLELFEYRFQFLHSLVNKERFGTVARAWRQFRDYQTDPSRAASFEEELLLPTWSADNRSKLNCAWLLEYVLSMRDAHCSDPRDKIYAVLAIASRHVPPGTKELLRPDYTQSVASIYTSFAQLLVRQLGTLNFLGAVEHASLRSTTGLPSWVPDFFVAFTTNIYRQVASGFKLPPELLASLFPRLRISYDQDELLFKAIRVDKIEAIQAQAGFKRHDSLTNLLDLLDLCKPCPKTLDGQGRVEQLWRTLLRDSCSEPGKLPWRPARADLKSCFHAYVITLIIEAFGSTTEADNELETVVDLVKGLWRDFALEASDGQFPSYGELGRSMAYFAEAGEDWIYKTHKPIIPTGIESRDAVTKLKGLVGEWEEAMARAQATYDRCGRGASGRLCSAGPDMRVGDEIWFAPAASLPLVLRPLCAGSERIYRFVSMAYVHGIMDGELFLRGDLQVADLSAIRVR